MKKKVLLIALVLSVIWGVTGTQSFVYADSGGEHEWEIYEVEVTRKAVYSQHAFCNGCGKDITLLYRNYVKENPNTTKSEGEYCYDHIENCVPNGTTWYSGPLVLDTPAVPLGTKLAAELGLAGNGLSLSEAIQAMNTKNNCNDEDCSYGIKSFKCKTCGKVYEGGWTKTFINSAYRELCPGKTSGGEDSGNGSGNNNSSGNTNTSSPTQPSAPSLDGIVNGKLYTNGTVRTDVTGLVQSNGAWVYIQKGNVSSYTGLVNNRNGWFYVQNGKVNFNYTGLVSNRNGWFYVQKGKINFGYTGLVRNKNGWFYVQRGKINFGYTGIVKYNNTYWFVQRGKLNFSAAGLVKYGRSYWVVQKGRINTSYNGYYSYRGRRYWIYRGRVIR